MPHRGFSTRSRLLLLTVALFALAAVVLAQTAGVPAPRRPLHASMLSLFILFALAESVRLHIQVRDNAQGVTLTDVVMVVALFTVSPLQSVLLRLAGGVLVALWLCRRSLIRFVVNVGIMTAESAVAGAVLTALARVDATSTRSWVGAVAAVTTSGLLSALAVVVAIAITGERQTARGVLRGLTIGGTVSAVAGIFGLVCAIVAATNRHGWSLLLVVTLIGLAIYRGYGRLLERKVALESVHAFGRILDDGHDSLALLRLVLNQVPSLVSAGHVEVVLLDDSGLTRSSLLDGELNVEPGCQSEWPLREVLVSGQPQLLRRPSRGRSIRQVLRGEAAQEAIIAALPGPSGVAGALIATHRIGQVRGFRRRDLLLLETLARHAGAAMTKLGLVQQLRHDVAHDRLTGLLNREGLTTALNDMNESPAVVLLLRVSSVRDVTDALGHAAGDRLLRATADRIRAHLGEATAVGRLDGDLFAVLLRDACADGAEAVAERLLAVVTEPVELAEVPLALGAAVGVARGAASSSLIRQAEIALQAAQRGGGVPVVVYDRAMEPPSVRRLSIAAELRRVLADSGMARQVVPYYQPQADLVSGRILGVEALVRWQHPERGLIPPGEFIPVVESTDLVRPLTLHVLDQALSDAARWARNGTPLLVAVNLSARSLFDRNLVQDVAELLGVHAVAPETLTLEITECAVMEDVERAQDVLEGLAGLGVTLSVDDFGTGYSSLAYLARLPVSEVKVDRAFVSRMTSDTRDAVIVRSVIDLGHNLNLRVVAEGVETQSCWQALTEAGADIAQGFLLSRPLQVDVLEQWLRDYDADAFRWHQAPPELPLRPRTGTTPSNRAMVAL